MTFAGKVRSLVILAALLFPGAAALPQAPAANSAPVKSYKFDIHATQQWLDTKIDLRSGEKLRITTTGVITYPEGPSGKPQKRTFGPDGLPRAWWDLVHQYAVPDASHGALIARLGSSDAAQPFLVGATNDFQAPVAGRLFLGINQSLNDATDASGNFTVTIDVLAPGLASPAAAVAGGPSETPIPSITSVLLDEIPRRVSDAQGHPGDMVNILIVGSQDELLQAFAAAGWVRVDSSVGNAVLTAITDSLEKKDYLTMPMSTLYLFQRPQNFGFAHAEPVRVAMSRNHLRAWKSPYKVADRTLWCVAATHDIGFERDQRNDGITHKIDPAIDGEREYVNNTLSATGFVLERTHVTPSNPLAEANTATGGSFHSDGRILVLILKPLPVSSNP